MTKSGVSIDKEALAAFFKALDGKTVTEACAAGAKKQVKMPSGGGRAAPAGGAAAGAGAAAAAPAEAAKEEEKEEVDMGNLFGDEEEDY
jgi:large subunit ribosomal protein LP2